MSATGDTVLVPTLDELRELVDGELQRTFAASDAPVAELASAIEYSLLGPGKRVRPLLTMLAAEACGASPHEVVSIAAAFELVHTYSLVHDDLPAMDDDDLRRGRPTSHCAYGEAVAILVGDALQARAFGLVADAPLVAERRIDIVRVLAHAAGWRGMVGGQYLDIDETRADAHDLDALRQVHDRKTGAMIEGAVVAGVIAAGADDDARAAASRFGRELGWLFQLVDDLLDATGSEDELGKTPGKDAESGKITAIDAFGGVQQLERAVDAQLARCLDAAQRLPRGGARLVEIARYVRTRRH